MSDSQSARYILALDTANEVIALGVGLLCEKTGPAVSLVASRVIPAHRASNTQLLPQADALLSELGISRSDIACLVVGRGPGSFTGVRIAMATAKGAANALRVPLIGVSSLDAVAQGAHAWGIRGRVLVAADAMRKEIYPVRYLLTDAGVERLEADSVAKAETAAAAISAAEDPGQLSICGDALNKYAELFQDAGTLLPAELWTPSGEGLLLAFQAAWRKGECDPRDKHRHDPAFVLPVYTRLSDAEENERIRLAQAQSAAKDAAPAAASVDLQTKDLNTGVQGDAGTAAAVTFRPLDAVHCGQAAALDARIFGSDVWSEALFADELPRKDRMWWMALHGSGLVGYCGGWVVDGQLQILKVGVEPELRRQGIARELLGRVADDARNLGASECTLEVRVGNTAARTLYTALGMAELGIRPHYYSDREDAVIMTGPLPVLQHDVAGMQLEIDAGRSAQMAEAKAGIARPLILAIESSCDETAAAIVDGNGMLVADVVASQIDFHARFGGVVPEIASRKHIEAICGVCDECLDVAAEHLGLQRGSLNWSDLDGVGVTYAPGLVGALVVGVAYAKGAAWAADKPFIGVNHLEGHLYANKIGAPDFQPPAVVSLVSGGNTMLVHMKDWGDYETLGTTIDDAVGEAFDKVAKALDLGYPGGPIISRYAAKGNPAAVNFPRAMLHSGDLRFSLSGLKTAVVTYINQQRSAGESLNIPDIAASFQQAVVDVQVAKAKTALEQTGARTFCLGGGVAANPVLRAAYEDLCEKMDIRLVMPPLRSCGDNAGMIALVALDRFRQERFFGLDADAHAHVNLDEPY